MVDKSARLKAHPFIIDEALAPRPVWLDRPRYERLVGAAARAERFLFSPAASGLIGRFCVDCGDLIMQHRQFAIPPYDEMYFEFQKPFFDALPRTMTDPESGRVVAAPVSDTRIGYLLSGRRVYVFPFGIDSKSKQNGGDEGGSLMPVYYTWAAAGEMAAFDRPEIGRPISFTGERAQWNHLGIILGTALHKLRDDEMREQLHAEVKPHVFPEWSHLVQRQRGSDQLANDLANLLQGCSGDLRNVWAALLWLNRPVHTVITNQPAGRRFLRGKSVAYRAHHAVEIDLHKHRSIRRAFVLSGERLSPRRHKVRGAFHHSGGQFACSHDWPLMPDVDGHWKCHRCGRLRWWQKDHVRGDATRGWVDHTYEATTGG